MSNKFKTAGHVDNGIWITVVVAISVFVLCFMFTSINASAVGNSGWVEIRVSVPNGFDDTIIATFVQDETYEEYACRVLAINDYVTITELPAGKYTFDGAFLESSDFRYSTSLTNGAQTFEVSADPNAAAALIELKTVYHEEYSDGAGTPPTEETEPIKEEPVPDTEPSEDVPEPSEGETEASGNTEPSEPSEDKETEFSVKDRLIRYAIATGIFIAVVFLVAFLLQRHIKNN